MEGLQEELAAIRREVSAMAETQVAFRDEVRSLLASGRHAQQAVAKHQAVAVASKPTPVLVPAPPDPEKIMLSEDSHERHRHHHDHHDHHDRQERTLTTASASSMSRVSMSGPSEAEVKHMLETTLKEAEAEEEERRREEEEQQHVWRYYSEKLRKLSRDELEMAMDSAMGAVICANAIFIGFSMDMNDNSMRWLAADIVFSVLFLTELASKIYLRGFKAQFCVGKSHFANILDASLVLIDVVQLIMALAGFDDAGDMPSASLFRLLRLLKLARVLCVLRTEVFADLLSMIQGMMGGLTTLAWSMVLFFLTVYMVALLFREYFGRDPSVQVNRFFDGIPRSMLTTFRCAFGDCSTEGGTPLFEHIHQAYGAPASAVCCLFLFTITIGLFNVISAIFVESTMVAAMKLENTKRRQRLANRKLWVTRICTLIRQLLKTSPDHEVPEVMSEAVDDLLEIDLPAEIINEFVKDPIAIEALNDLEIDQEDHEYLSDILDPDNSGSVGINEFIDGLRRLRGVPRRSDIVSVDLMVRSIQQRVCDIQTKVSSFIDNQPVVGFC